MEQDCRTQGRWLVKVSVEGEAWSHVWGKPSSPASCTGAAGVVVWRAGSQTPIPLDAHTPEERRACCPLLTPQPCLAQGARSVCRESRSSLSALGSPDAPLLHTLLQMPPPRAPCSALRGLRFYLHPPGDNDLFITWWGGRMLLKLLRASARARQATRQLYRHKTVGHLRVSVNPDSLGF